MANMRPSFVSAGTFLIMKNSTMNKNDGISQPCATRINPNVDDCHHRVVGVNYVWLKDVHREIGQPDQNGYNCAPAKIPKRAPEQIGINFFLRIRIKPLLHRHIHQIEKIEQPDPGDACDEVGPAQKNSDRQRQQLGRMKQILKHRQTDGEMNS